MTLGWYKSFSNGTVLPIDIGVEGLMHIILVPSSEPFLHVGGVRGYYSLTGGLSLFCLEGGRTFMSDFHLASDSW